MACLLFCCIVCCGKFGAFFVSLQIMSANGLFVSVKV
jgi:hypothetical protein